MSASGTVLERGPAPTARPAPAADDLPPRLGRLAAALDEASERRGPEPRALLLVLGALSVGAGGAAIGLGWYGAAHSPYLFQELPYVISGGLLGLALVVAGAALVVGSWVVRLAQEAQRAASRLDQIADLLAMQRSTTVTVADHHGDPERPTPSYPTTDAVVDDAGHPPVRAAATDPAPAPTAATDPTSGADDE